MGTHRRLADDRAAPSAPEKAQDAKVNHRHDWIWDEEKTEGYCAICRLDWEDRPADYEE